MILILMMCTRCGRWVKDLSSDLLCLVNMYAVCRVDILLRGVVCRRVVLRVCWNVVWHLLINGGVGRSVSWHGRLLNRWGSGLVLTACPIYICLGISLLCIRLRVVLMRVLRRNRLVTFWLLLCRHICMLVWRFRPRCILFCTCVCGECGVAVWV